MKKNNFRNKLILFMILAAMMSGLTSCGSSENSDETIAANGIAEKTADNAAAPTDDTAEAAAGDTEAAAEAADEDFGFITDIAEAYPETGGDGGFAALGRTAKSLEADGAFEEAEGFYYEEAPETYDVEADIMIEPEEDAAAFVLTAGEWNDNDNWGFFTNLVNNGTIEFPSFGIDPRNRIEVTVTNGSEPAVNCKTELLDESGNIIWTAKTDKNGKAYMFYRDSDSPKTVRTENAEADIQADAESNENDQQGNSSKKAAASANIDNETAGVKYSETEVMFILDTTGSMGDEIAYLQKDFSSIAEEVGSDSISFSVNFYRDEGDDYVTKCNPFTKDIKEAQRLLNAETADGGGDLPEAVAQVLNDTITNGVWSEDTNKIAFLIFDAPPHDGTDDMIITAIKTAAEKGIHLVPVVASNADRSTELFGRAAAICTNSNYVFLTDDSGVGGSHLEPIIGDYDVELLHDIIVRNILLAL